MTFFSPKSFAKDHIVRTEDGRPLGRIVLRNDSATIGQDLPVAILQIPKAFQLNVLGLIIWIDEYSYRIGKVAHMFERNDSIILSNFVLERWEDVDNG